MENNHFDVIIIGADQLAHRQPLLQLKMVVSFSFGAGEIPPVPHRRILIPFTFTLLNVLEWWIAFEIQPSSKSIASNLFPQKARVSPLLSIDTTATLSPKLGR